MTGSIEHRRGEYVVTTDPARVQIDVVHGYLTNCYWAEGIPRSTVERSVENSLCFALLKNEEQIGFARVITDQATYAYVADVFILDGHRGRGLSKWMMECILALRDFRGCADGRWSPGMLTVCTASSGLQPWANRSATWKKSIVMSIRHKGNYAG